MKRLLAAFGLAAVLAGPAYADGTINTLTSGSALTGTEQIPMFQGANPAVTTTPSAIKTYINPVTSISTSCGITGGPITTTGTISGAATDSAVATATYTLVSGDCGLVKRFTNASAVTITVPTPTGFATGYYVTLKCESAGGCTTSGTINGSTTIISIPNGASLDLYVDGSSAWHSLQGTPPPSFVSHGSYAASSFYGTWPGQVVPGSASTANTVYFYPFFISQTLTLTSLNLYVTTAGTGTSAMVGVYNDALGVPTGAAMCVPASSAATTGTGNIAFTVSCTLPGPGWYWAATNTGGGTPQAIFMSIGGSATTAGSFLGNYLIPETTAALANGNGGAQFAVEGYKMTNTLVSGAMPTPSALSVQAGGSVVPHIVIGN